ncbi:MAG: low molecular weight phosphotyrosine protein phosphatase [Gammaproteobacteria bacterium]|nr:low molecular weight phosphotyrosine protein phosphatase [Gammaproteobacteria bacterium]MCP4088767.1 low molecular weight phosphotyrosine protein phosphatase [Gammaproteobacteria bacterium]MCP4275934.1 low molecular weight phosphotyrosine protein phosphatase [Gammaproteobacteria bacterium]MCP4832150.1 low molecular weight phosphotyrosine protein phosphatase [Gammaproteobacteria bacterium]MCP4928249.1 low molecular weight phosphotyrosine protein phosphatase [Gammaproteobacteria bacterium]
MADMVSILFVCMGNICRSPSAHGVMRKLLEEEGEGLNIQLDSAGTHAWHINEAPDPRSQQAALAREVDLSDLRARAVEASDFHKFDYILAMDEANLADLDKIRPPGSKALVALMLSYADKAAIQEVPDPYYGAKEGFETVLDMLEEASRGLLTELRQC